MVLLSCVRLLPDVNVTQMVSRTVAGLFVCFTRHYFRLWYHDTSGFISHTQKLIQLLIRPSSPGVKKCAGVEPSRNVLEGHSFIYSNGWKRYEWWRGKWKCSEVSDALEKEGENNLFILRRDFPDISPAVEVIYRRWKESRLSAVNISWFPHDFHLVSFLVAFVTII